MNDIWQPQFSILSMFLHTYAKYHLANPIFIGAEGEGLAIEAKIYGPPPMYNLLYTTRPLPQKDLSPLKDLRILGAEAKQKL